MKFCLGKVYRTNGLFLVILSLWLSACHKTVETDKVLRLAQELERQGNFEKAADLYHELAHRKPEDFHTNYQAALIYFQINNLEEAKQHFESAIVANPQSGVAHLNLGVVLARTGQKQAAERQFLEALRLDPRLTRAYYNLGLFAVDDGRLDEAERYLRQALALDPNRQRSQVRLGNLLVRKKKFSEALEVLDRAIKLDPTDAVAFFNLALAYAGTQKGEHSMKRLYRRPFSTLNTNRRITI